MLFLVGSVNAFPPREALTLDVGKHRTSEKSFVSAEKWVTQICPWSPLEKLVFPLHSIPNPHKEQHREKKIMNVRTEKRRKPESRSLNYPIISKTLNFFRKNQYPENVGEEKKKKGTQTDKIFCNNFQNPHKFPQSPVEKQHFPSTFHSKTTEKSMPMNKIEGKRVE